MLKIIFQTEESPPELRQFDVLSLLKPPDSVTWIEQEENCQYHLPFWAHLLVEQMHGPSRKQNNVVGSVRCFLTNSIDLGVTCVFKAALWFSRKALIGMEIQNNKNVIRKKSLDGISV